MRRDSFAWTCWLDRVWSDVNVSSVYPVEAETRQRLLRSVKKEVGSAAWHSNATPASPPMSTPPTHTHTQQPGLFFIFYRDISNSSDADGTCVCCLCVFMGSLGSSPPKNWTKMWLNKVVFSVPWMSPWQILVRCPLDVARSLQAAWKWGKQDPSGNALGSREIPLRLKRVKQVWEEL